MVSACSPFDSCDRRCLADRAVSFSLLTVRGSSPFPPLGSVAEHLTRHDIMHNDGVASGAANDPTVADVAIGGIADLRFAHRQRLVGGDDTGILENAPDQC